MFFGPRVKKADRVVTITREMPQYIVEGLMESTKDGIPNR